MDRQIKYRQHMDQPLSAYLFRSALEDFTTPLIFEPGTWWEYSVSIDWLGFIVEKISGLELHQYIQQHIAIPLGLKMLDRLTPEQLQQSLIVHAKDDNGNLTALPDLRPIPERQVSAGGTYLYCTCEDCANFCVTLLTGGTHPISNVTILQPQTVKDYLFTDMIPKIGCSNENIGKIPSTIAATTKTGVMLPGVQQGWSCGFMINNEDVPNGRNKGSGAWAGLGNCYYWLDPVGGRVGVLVSAVLPFFDRVVLHLADALERAVYAHTGYEGT